MPKISVVIITFNEERNIVRCLQSLKGVADEIIIVDSGSTDSTRNLCRAHGVTFIEHPFDSYGPQKNRGIQAASSPYILSLDADEVLSNELKDSILFAKSNWTVDAYTFNRRTNFCGKWIKHTGWYPDRKLRLWDSRKGLWNNTPVHERIVLDKGSIISHLKGDLLHYSFYTIEQHIAQINKYSTIKADNDFIKNKKAPLYKILLAPAVKFITTFFFKAGFLDGFYGFVISRNSAYSHFLKFVKLRNLHKRNL